MAIQNIEGTVTLEELMVSSLAKLLIEKGLLTESEFMGKLSVERATYQAMLLTLLRR